MESPTKHLSLKLTEISFFEEHSAHDRKHDRVAIPRKRYLLPLVLKLGNLFSPSPKLGIAWFDIMSCTKCEKMVAS